MDIRIVGRPGSKAVTRIVKNTGLGRYTKKCNAVVNYGLAGKRFRKFVTKHPSLANKPIINKFIGCSKYKAIKDAEDAGIKVPKTFMSLSRGQDPSNFLTKKMHSQGGVGIVQATKRSAITGKYYQEFIQNRKYELRVHGFAWVDDSEWLIQKRFGKEGEIAWNYHNGGRFQSIRHPNKYELFTKAKKIAKKALEIRNMSFGAVDFLVTTGGDILFIEVNSAPGFTELSEGAYINAFEALNRLSKTEIFKYCR